MKKTFIGLCLSAVSLVACHKDHNNSPKPAQLSIIGKWNIDTVTTYFYDSIGVA